MPTYGYNYPWSGRLGSITDCCIYCGDSGPSFQMSSRGARCCRCNSNSEPIPELLEKYTQEYERLAKEWCVAHGLDYEATIQNYFDNLGPKSQERDGPIPNAEIDYSVKINQ
jgi:hypothetical protein